jgi:hypothetical protein
MPIVFVCEGPFETGVDALILQGDESGYLLLEGDESGHLLLEGDMVG